MFITPKQFGPDKLYAPCGRCLSDPRFEGSVVVIQLGEASRFDDDPADTLSAALLKGVGYLSRRNEEDCEVRHFGQAIHVRQYRPSRDDPRALAQGVCSAPKAESSEVLHDPPCQIGGSVGHAEDCHAFGIEKLSH